ncbi:beta-galactosidase trimerization domain-containing protein [candidate division KSB1 bacterium]|nr:beta-galactosidase trimerization domain-containing protein [candidate division KSB1 bacterium]
MKVIPSELLIQQAIIILLFLSFLGIILLNCSSRSQETASIHPDDRRPWYQKPMRIAALQCNFEAGKTLDVIDKWVEMGFNVEQLFHPMADDYSALYDPAKHRELLESYLEKANRNNLKIILYLNVHILGPSLMEHKERWAQRDASGKILMLYDTYPAVCLHSPWRQHFFEALDSLAELDIHGIFLDGPVIQKTGCHCEFCQRKYLELYEKPLPPNGSHEFNRLTRDEYLKRAYAHWKKLKPESIFYMNLPITHCTPLAIDINSALTYNDILGTEGGFMFYGPPKKSFLWRPGFTAKLLEGTAPDKPRVIFMAGDQKPWSWYLHSPMETRLCIASCVSNAANVWWGIHGSTKLLTTESAQVAGDMFRFLKQNEAIYDTSRSMAKVALVYSYTSEHAYSASYEESDFTGKSTEKSVARGNLTEAMYGYYEMLLRSQIPFDVITDLKHAIDSFSSYDCIILPSTGCLPDDVADALRGFVMSGGHLIAGFDCTLYDSSGRMQDNFALSDVFGVNFDKEYVALANHNYFQSENDNWLFTGLDIPLYPAPLQAIRVRPYLNARVLARLLKPLPGRYVPLTAPDLPFIIHNNYGKGECLFIAGTLGEMYHHYNPIEYRKLLKNAIERFSEPVLQFDEHYGALEVVFRRQGERIIVHLINHNADMTRPIEHVLPLGNVSFTLDSPFHIGTVYCLSTGRQIPVRREQQRVSVTLRDLGVYETVVFEK